MHVWNRIDEWWAERASPAWAKSTVGFVPTMGALHAGHVALLARARAENERVVLSVFVNPTQFDDPADLERYPRTLAADLELARPHVDAVLAPTGTDLYPDHYRYRVTEGALSRRLEGAQRPGHFDGVLTVVLKLLNLVQPRRAYFGEKDWQQVRVLEDMIRDLDLSVKLVRVPIVREKDGLALSSRNAYLSPTERRAAPALRAALTAGRIEARRPHSRPETVAAAVRHALAGTGLKVQYAAVWNGRLLAAAYLGRTRLIDNLSL